MSGTLAYVEMGGGTILVVDDDQPIRMALRVLLEGEGYRVVEACDGTQALELLDTDRPDLVLLDVMMPAMSGHEFLHILRGQRDDNGLPVIVMTALPGALVSQFLAAGANDFIAKPFDSDQMLNKVALALVRTAWRRERRVVLWVDRDHEREPELNRLLNERGFTLVNVSERADDLSRLASALAPRAIVVNSGDRSVDMVRQLRDEPMLDAVPILARTTRPAELTKLDAHAADEPLEHDDVLAFIARPPSDAARLPRG